MADWEKALTDNQQLHREGMRAYFEKMIDVVTQDARAYKQAIIYINGGAVVAVMSLLAAVWPKDNDINQVVIRLTQALIPFTIGLVLATFVAGLSYLTNFANSEDAKDMLQQLSTSRPWSPSPWRKVGPRLHRTAIGCAVLSLLAFCCGVVQVYSAIPAPQRAAATIAQPSPTPGSSHVQTTAQSPSPKPAALDKLAPAAPVKP